MLLSFLNACYSWHKWIHREKKREGDSMSNIHIYSYQTKQVFVHEAGTI